jgi:hypothetical protein
MSTSELKPKKKLAKVPGISPDLWIEVPEDTSDKDLQMKFNKIIETDKQSRNSLKIVLPRSKKVVHHKHYDRSYTGPIYNLNELKNNF